ncbi:TrmH family RNA methyltransferase [Kaistia sp. MMO-174]|uniref:TrmH family RNA methyltransferase n=1 Tax=Kaistia sp. MMO-174 TaxID=3081256 RepID=UPI0030172109
MADPHDIAAPGAVRTITSLTNPTIKDIRGLALPKNRKESGLFVTEGMKLVADAVEENWPIKILVYGAKVADHPVVKRVATTARARGGDVLEVSEAVLSKITRRDNPQMVVGVFEQRLTPKSEVRPGPAGVWVALEGIKDPGNLGTIIRTADAVGAEGVILVGDTVDPFGVEAVRATMGSIFHMKLARMAVDEFKAWRKGWPGIVVGTHLSGKSDYRAVDYDRPVMLFMGNEQSGLPDDLAALCDHLVKIPQAGRADSLNLAIATGVMLYEIRRDKLKL